MEQPRNDISADGSQLVLGTFANQQRAGAAVQALRARGLADEQISAVVRHGEVEVTAQEMAALEREAESVATDVAVGSAAGGLAGFLAGLALFSIPGIGQFLGVGVLASTLGGAALGSAVGERVGHFSALGLSEERAERYQSALAAGHTVLAVHAPDTQTAAVAREVLVSEGAEEIDVHPEGTATDDGTTSSATTPGRSSP